ncbi:hypothetical protein F8388_000994 [Cannabis sativa]|uniref:Uncharacterized protein n=1 Tax=Cannabis sativa TaxID=3483 RepID=A0A7J6FXF2_CANSA|nr:hypothetical protein F8388_000994 [Cannabis sativa]
MSSSTTSISTTANPQDTQTLPRVPPTSDGEVYLTAMVSPSTAHAKSGSTTTRCLTVRTWMETPSLQTQNHTVSHSNYGL